MDERSSRRYPFRPVPGTVRIRAFALIALFSGLILQALPAVAQEQAIGGTLSQRAEEGEDPVPVEGVVITVTQDGNEVGSATTDAEGNWTVPVPAPGDYDVALDASTLPPGVTLSDPERSELTDINVRPGQTRRVIFQLGGGGAGGTSTWDRVASLVVVGLKLGAIIALSSVGLSLIFGVTGLVNFSHAELVTLGAFIAYVFHAGGPRWPLVVAALPAVLFGVTFGWGQEKVLWGPLRRRGMGVLTMMVVSIGLGFALRFLILAFFGGLPRAYPDFASQRAVAFLGFSVVPKHVVAIVAALVILGGVGLFLERTLAGTALRAVRDNPDLAESSGIAVDRVVALTWALGAGLAAIGGVFFGVTESVQWSMGFDLLLLMFAAVVLGGLGTAYGAMLGGFVVGISVEMSTLFFPNELKNAVGLVLLIIMLIWRPQGLLGVRERIG